MNHLEKTTDFVFDTPALVREFCELVSIDSLSLGERQMADLLKKKLAQLGAEVYEDQAGAHYGASVGNVYGFFHGSLPGDPLLFTAHMDTVAPGIGKQAIVHEDGRITSDGTTVLGSDDLAGVAEILAAIRHLKTHKIPHRDLEVLFTISEETYLQGSSRAEFDRLRAKDAYILDIGGELGIYSSHEPTLLSFQALIHGKASHAGLAPEEGIHAIGVAAEAIHEIPQGHVTEETIVNIGTISGGLATNIVPDLVEIRGEVRSFIHTQALETAERIRGIFQAACDAQGATLEYHQQVPLVAYYADPDSSTVRRFQQACQANGIQAQPLKSFGGSDNNAFRRNGIAGLTITCGMHNIHTVEEYTTIPELETITQVVIDLMTDC